MKKTLVFLLITVAASAQAACTFELRNDTDDFIWVVPQDWGNEPLLMSSKSWTDLKASPAESRLNPRKTEIDSEEVPVIDSKQVTVLDAAPLYIYVEKRSFGGIDATGGRVGGTYYQAIVTKAYKIIKKPKSSCPGGPITYSNIKANKVPGLFVQPIHIQK